MEEIKDIGKIINDRCEADKNTIYDYMNNLVSARPELKNPPELLPDIILSKIRELNLFTITPEEESEADLINQGSRKRVEEYAKMVSKELAEDIIKGLPL
ncbi:MAG: hypothetical protein WCO18_00340 [bacterium]